MSKNDGGQMCPGFPSTEDGRGILSEGITRRDWLAGLAMQALVGTLTAWVNHWQYDPPSAKDVAKTAYKFADALIAEGNPEEAAHV